MRSDCYRCGEPLDGSNNSYCKECFAAYMRERRKRNPALAERGRVLNRAYKRRERERCTERQRLRRARMGPQRTRVVSLVVLELHDGVCGICGDDVDPLAFEVDHRVPLARGGMHDYDNCQPAHPSCNRRKYDKEAA